MVFGIFCDTRRHVGIFGILCFHDFILVFFFRLLVFSIKIIILIFFIYYFNFLNSFYIPSTFVIHNFSGICSILDSILYYLNFYYTTKSEFLLL